MKNPSVINNILANYSSESIGVRSNLYKILVHGKTGGSGNLVILPVDQGFEHGPDRSFSANHLAYDPDYHFELAIEAGLSAYAAPLGFLAASAARYIGQIPTILKINSSTSLLNRDLDPDQAITASVKDAIELGCCAVGVTIYPGSNNSLNMLEEAREIIKEAKAYGLPTVIWAYPRGKGLGNKDETSLDICAYAAHIAALLGAHIIKVKPPTLNIAQAEVKNILTAAKIEINSTKSAVEHVVQSCFAGKRIVIFSGGMAKEDDDILSEVRAIKAGGGNGSIIGRNCFQRPREEALALLDEICKIYTNS